MVSRVKWKPRVCENCDFMDHGYPDGDKSKESIFLCRRRPPRPGEETMGAWWPQVDADDWCGEFKPREDV